MKRLRVLAGSILMLSFMLGACSILGERGSGTMAIEAREVSGFSEVDLSGSGTVLVSVTGTESLTIEAEDNILPLLTSEVRDGRLILGAKQSISPTRDIVYTVTVISLEAVAVSGSGSITAIDVDANRFEVDISGSGTVTPEGVSEHLDLSISGSGVFKGEVFESATGTVSVSGSGEAIVNVTDDLEVDVSGSGTVRYIADPSVSSSISGSGEISRR
jgi:hypothetical protein